MRHRLSFDLLRAGCGGVSAFRSDRRRALPGRVVLLGGMRVCAPLESDTCCHVDAVRLVSSLHWGEADRDRAGVKLDSLPVLAWLSDGSRPRATRLGAAPALPRA